MLSSFFCPSIEKLRQHIEFPGVPSLGVSRSCFQRGSSVLWCSNHSSGFNCPWGGLAGALGMQRSPARRRRRVCEDAASPGAPGDSGAEELQRMAFAGKPEVGGTALPCSASPCPAPTAAPSRCHPRPRRWVPVETPPDKFPVNVKVHDLLLEPGGRTVFGSQQELNPRCRFSPGLAAQP